MLETPFEATRFPGLALQIRESIVDATAHGRLVGHAPHRSIHRNRAPVTWHGRRRVPMVCAANVKGGMMAKKSKKSKNGKNKKKK